MAFPAWRQGLEQVANLNSLAEAVERRWPTADRRPTFRTFPPFLPIKSSEERTMNTGRISGILGCAAVGALLAAAVTGCQQYATYPPVEVTAKLQRPAAEPVPTIIATSIQYARDNFVASKTLPINLPAGVP